MKNPRSAPANGYKLVEVVGRSGMRKLIAGLSGMALLAAAAVRAGRAPYVYSESSEVSLVEVPVNVIGRDGKPVEGLQLSDFEVRDNGKRQKLLYLDVTDLRHRSGVPGGAPGVPAVARRHFLLLFDLSFATPNEIVHSRRAAANFIAHVMEPDDLAAVGIISAEKGARLLVTFTSDRVQLGAAIRRLGLPDPSAQVRDPLAFAFTLPGDPFLAKIAPAEAFGAFSEQFSIAKVFGMIAQKTADAYSTSRVEQHLGGLASLGEALDAVEGRKTIIYFSEGFDGRLLVGNSIRKAEDNFADNESMLAGQYWTLDVDKRYANAPLQREFSAALTILRRSDCVVYPIDIAGLRNDGDVTFGEGMSGEDSLYMIASETGGEVIKNANDLDEQMRRIAERTSLTYVLSFSPSESLGPGTFHRLKVKTSASGARVSARAGYYENRQFRSLTPLERSLAAADVIMNDRPVGDIPLEVLALPLCGNGISHVPVVVQMPPSIAAGLGPIDRLRLGLYVYVTNEEGKLEDFFTRSLTLDMAREGARLALGGLTYYGMVRLSPGDYNVRVYVRDEDRGNFGFHVTKLSVPAIEPTGLLALPPVFIRSDGAGVNIRDPQARPVDGEEPFQLGESVFVPKVSPRLSPGTSSRICLMLYQKGPAGAAPFQVVGEILDRAGRAMGAAHISVVGRSAADESGLVKLLVDFSSGELPAGDYSLRVVFRDAADASLNSASEAKFHIS
jgi:VWFA-related protein